MGGDLSNEKSKQVGNSNTDRLEIEQMNAMANLKCMRGIDPAFLPLFKFFQFKRSTVDMKDIIEG